MKPEIRQLKPKFLPAAPGTCAMCGTNHEPHLAHNYWSIFYQMRFKAKYERDATHADTVAHLKEHEQQQWMTALKSKGVEWTEHESPIAEPYAD